MAGLRPPLPLRRLDGPAQPPHPDQGGGATGNDRVIVTTPLTNTVRTTSTTQRDVTQASLRSRAAEGGWCQSQVTLSVPATSVGEEFDAVPDSDEAEQSS